MINPEDKGPSIIVDLDGGKTDGQVKMLEVELMGLFQDVETLKRLSKHHLSKNVYHH